MKISILTTAIKSFFKFDANNFEKSDVVFFSADVDRPVVIKDGKQFSPIIDSIFMEFESIGVKCSSYALPWSRLSKSRTFFDVKTINKKFLWAKILKKVFKYLGADKLSLEISKNPYRSVLKESKPRLVLGIGLPPDLCESCKELSIDCYEVLHSMGYSRHTWGWNNRSETQLPTGVVCFDKTSFKTFKKFGRGLKIFHTMHPYFSKIGNINNFSKTYPGVFKSVTSIEVSANTKKMKKVCVFLQWGYSGELDRLSGILDNGLFPDCLIDIIEATRETIDWHFRFHPVQIVEPKYKRQFDYIDSLSKNNANVFWKYATNEPLPFLLSQVDLCIGMSTHAVYDAASFGKKSALLCPTVLPGGYFENCADDLVNEGLVAKFSPSFDSIFNWIQTTKTTLDRKHSNGKKSQISSVFLKNVLFPDKN